MQPNKILIWDFDGTLAERPGGWTGALLSVFKQHIPAPASGDAALAGQIRSCLQSGFPWFAPENPHPGLSADEWWEELQPVFSRAFRAAGASPADAWKMAGAVRPVYLDPSGWRRFDDALPALSALTARGWTHVLLANNVPELPSLLPCLGFSGQFAAVFNSGETGYEKPNPKAFRAVIDWAGPAAEMVVIGDDYIADVTGAQEAGLKAVLVRNPHPNAGIFSQSLLELENILETGLKGS
ncbi:MAG: HAD-IA family hydrolase [Chloroflexi bacterium]|nr:HAD-IA family hydrolase [Chloroflexota bacterium]